MDIKFNDFIFSIVDDKILLKECGFFKTEGFNFVDTTVLGRCKNSHMGTKINYSSEGREYILKEYYEKDNVFTVVQETECVRSTLTIKYIYDGTYLINNTLINLTDKEIIIEECPTITLKGFFDDEKKNIKFTNFIQSHHYEVTPNAVDLGMFDLTNHRCAKKLEFTNSGAWSTKEALPCGIVEYKEQYMMFNIYSSSCWHYEFSDFALGLYLAMGYPTFNNNSFSKKLKPNEEFKLLPVSISFDKDLSSVISKNNRVRRLFYNPSSSDKQLPSIFNEYMHMSWDSPNEERTLSMLKFVKKLGIEYYVIDCGWHNEEPGNIIYPYVGQWMESHSRFPRGVHYIKEQCDKIGLKLGLWIEPEIIGHDCVEMLNYYDKDCFLQRNGVVIDVARRLFLDYENPKVVSYMNETMKRMIEDLGADYIKMDFNQDLGLGCDCKEGESFPYGYIIKHQAFLNWLDTIKQKYPHVVFEGCASGGMRMDSESVSKFSLVSTSDQTNYLLYPYIVGNIFAAVIPEQGAVWSYPVESDTENPVTLETFDDSTVSKSRVIINMVNSILGRMHLASHIDYLSTSKVNLVKEGIAYYNSIAEFKKGADVCMPNGLTYFHQDSVVVGLKKENKIILGVWGIHTNKVNVNLHTTNIKVAYPSKANIKIILKDDSFIVKFKETPMAAILEIEL